MINIIIIIIITNTNNNNEITILKCIMIIRFNNTRPENRYPDFGQQNRGCVGAGGRNQRRSERVDSVLNDLLLLMLSFI